MDISGAQETVSSEVSTLEGKTMIFSKMKDFSNQNFPTLKNQISREIEKKFQNFSRFGNYIPRVIDGEKGKILTLFEKLRHFNLGK